MSVERKKTKFLIWKQIPPHGFNITFTLPAFLENMLTGGPPLDGAPGGPAGPGICAMAGKPVGGGGGGLLCRITWKMSSELPVLDT